MCSDGYIMVNKMISALMKLSDIRESCINQIIIQKNIYKCILSKYC